MSPRSWRILWVAVGLLFAALVAFAWFVTSETGLHWALRRASALSGGRLVIEDVKRTGLASLTAGRVGYRDGDLQIEAHDALLSMSAASLFRGHPIVHSLRLGRLRIDLGSGSGTPPQRPQSLRAPTRFVLEGLTVDVLTWIRGEEATEARNLRLALSYDGAHYALALGSVETPWLAANGNARLGADAPFPLQGRFALQPRDERFGAVSLALAGELAKLGVGAVGSAYGAPVEAKASLLPFDANSLGTIEASVKGLDARAIAAAAPIARLDVALDASIDREGRAAGRFRVVNREPGPVASQRLPLQSLAARFAGAGLAWRFEQIDLDAGAAGMLSGSAQVEPHGMQAELQARALNLRALHPQLHATALAGPLHIESDWNSLAMQAAFAQSGVQIAVDALLNQGNVELKQASWNGAAGRIEVHGSAQTRPPYAVQAKGRLSRLDPSRLGDYPSAALNGTFDANGAIDPLDISVRLDVADSRFRGHALAVRGAARIVPERIAAVDVSARLGSAQASMQGGFGGAGDVLKWNVDIPDLRIAHDAAAGRLRGSGTVSGRWRDPAVELDVDAGALRFGEDLRAARVRGKGQMAEGLDGRLDLTVEAETLRVGELKLDRARAALEGQRDRHRARLESAGGGYRVEMRAAGGLDGALTWQGRLESLQVHGPLEGGIEQPVELMVSQSAARVGAARVRFGQGTIELAGFTWQAPGRITTRGTMSKVALASLQPLLPIPDALRALVIGARWEIDATDTLNGTLRIVREAGDVVVPGSPPLPAQLRSASIDARAQSNAISVDAQLDSTAFGTVTARAASQASMRNGFWGIAGDAPLDAAIDARMPSLQWTHAMLKDHARVDGAASLALQIRGRVGEPSYSGDLKAGGLRVSIPELGLALDEGSVAARFQGQELAVTALRFAAGSGLITGTGGASLAPGNITARLELDASQLTVLSRPDRLVVVSGRTAVRWDGKALRAEGKLTADRGLIELPPADTPRPSSDVVVIGRTSGADPRFGIEADLLFDLGKDFRLQGRGVSTRLAGALRIQLAPKGSPVVTGTVRALEGTYSAYGQKLTIQRGTLTFAGPVGNPALDILAVRKTEAVEVGVAVGGTALLPQVRLVSTPPMSDADKLAWLTLGRGLDQVAGNEAAVLQAAAMALLSGPGSGSGSQRTFANRIGLDELSLSKAATTGEQIVTLGKRFASNVYLGVERGVTGAVSVVKVTYDLSRRWSVQARAGSENAVDLFYTLGFR